MTYSGHVKNGVIVLDDPVDLADGQVVSVAVAAPLPTAAEAPVRTLREAYGDFIGVLHDMPEDWASNTDKYLCEEYLNR